MLGRITGPEVLDAEGVRLRMANVKVGQAIVVVGAIGTEIYALASWSSPNRTLMSVIAVITLLSAALVQALPVERIVRSRWREPAFVAWSALIVALVTATTATDGGTSSPTRVMYVLPLVFAALCYAPLSVAAVGAIDLAAFSTLAALSKGTPDLHPFVIIAFLGATGMCCLLALNREQQSEEVTAARKDLAASEASNRRRASQQQAVAAFGQRALAGAPIERLMQDAANTAKRMLEVDISTVVERQHDGSFLVRAGAGLPDGVVGVVSGPGGPGSLSGFTVESGGPVMVEDWATDNRFTKDQRIGEIGVTSILAVPIDAPAGAFGVFMAASYSRREFGSDEITFLQAIGNALSNAIERRDEEEAARHRALHDPLTGLPNRTLFADRLAHSLAEQERRGSKVAVLFLDVDHFKLVNDSLGHHAGDELLTAIGPRLQQALRPGDTVARFGGDEFGILLDDVSDERDATRVAEKLAGTLAVPFTVHGARHFVTVSVGIAVGGAGERPQELIRDADAAMYRAKERGRARYEIFDDEMGVRVAHRLRVENELRAAIDQGEFRVQYQPVVSLTTGRVIGAEALVRWNHPDRGIVAPGDFIPVAEEARLIAPIGRWVLEEACREASAWQHIDPDAPPPRISVNVSMRQLSDPYLVETVRRALDLTGVQPASLSLEVTEGAVMEDPETVSTSLHELKALGVLLVLDDFGTGYSSLGYLKRLPFDEIKLDQTFVRGLHVGEVDKAIVNAVVALAGTLGLTVVAEGIEEPEQLEIVRALGCQSAQGYYFSPPVEAAELAKMLETGLPAARR